jgi:hypothetical protein
VVLECVSCRVVAVQRDRIVDVHVFQRPADVIDVLLEFELGSVHADDHQSLAPIFLGPGCGRVLVEVTKMLPELGSNPRGDANK